MSFKSFMKDTQSWPGWSHWPGHTPGGLDLTRYRRFCINMSRLSSCSIRNSHGTPTGLKVVIKVMGSAAHGFCGSISWQNVLDSIQNNGVKHFTSALEQMARLSMHIIKWTHEVNTGRTREVWQKCWWPNLLYTANSTAELLLGKQPHTQLDYCQVEHVNLTL